MSENIDLPKGWERTTLGNISLIILGQSPSSSTYNEFGEGLPFYQGKYEFGKFYPTPQKWCTAPKKIAEKGDVLISVRAPVGPTNICQEKSCIGRGLAAVRGLGGINTLFILYLIRFNENDIAKLGTGTTFNAISGDQIKNFTISLPPLAEQHCIVARIEELFTKLDAGVESLKIAKAQLRRYRRAVLKSALNGKLTEEWRYNNPNVEPAYELINKISTEQGKTNKDHSLLSPSMPELPNTWAWSTYNNIGKWSGGGTPSKSDPSFWIDGDILWVTPKDMKTIKITDSEDKINANAIDMSSAKLILAKSLLFVVRSGILRRTLPIAIIKLIPQLIRI